MVSTDAPVVAADTRPRTVLACPPFEVLVPPLRKGGDDFAPPVFTFDCSLPSSLRGKMGEREFADMVDGIEKRLIEAFAEASRIYKHYCIPAVVFSICTMGFGSILMVPVFNLGDSTAATQLNLGVSKLREWIDVQNEQFWTCRGLQFGLIQTVVPVGEEPKFCSAGFVVRRTRAASWIESASMLT